MESTDGELLDVHAEDFRRGIEMHVGSLLRGSERFFIQLGTMQGFQAPGSDTPRSTLNSPLTGAEQISIQVAPRYNLRNSAPGPERRSNTASVRQSTIYPRRLTTTPNYRRTLIYLLNLPPHFNEIASDMFTSTELCQLYPGSIEYDSEELCPICQEKLGVITEQDPHVQFRCHHRFHTECIKEWLDTRRTPAQRLLRTCPMCRDNVNIILP